MEVEGNFQGPICQGQKSGFYELKAGLLYFSLRIATLASLSVSSNILIHLGVGLEWFSFSPDNVLYCVCVCVYMYILCMLGTLGLYLGYHECYKIPVDTLII